MGMSWKGKVFIDTALPFGLRSAPKNFTAVADALQWILAAHGVESLHYLDDFIIFGNPDSPECQWALGTAIEVCRRLGVPVAPQKTEGPAMILTFLDIETDTVVETVRLPDKKLQRLKIEIRAWTGRRSCTKKELLSLIGQLQHACCVVRPGRSFLRRMIDLAKEVKENHHWIWLNLGFRSDLQWWQCFLLTWNGRNMWSGIIPGAVLTSDASSTWGCGAFTSSGEWFQLEWPDTHVHITVKELLPIVISTAVWGHKWAEKTVRCAGVTMQQ